MIELDNLEKLFEATGSLTNDLRKRSNLIHNIIVCVCVCRIELYVQEQFL